jgi:peptide/nickel transport system permease protein
VAVINGVPMGRPDGGAGEGIVTGDAGAPTRSGGVILSTFLANKLAWVGLGLIVMIVLFCFVGPISYHTDQVSTNISIANLKPSGRYPLGTDDVGYNELGRLMVGGQSSIEIGFVTATIASVLGVLWGAVSGYFGGIVDAVMMRIIDALLSLPVLLVLLVVASLYKPNAFNLTVAVALFAWLVPARLVRGEALTLRTREEALTLRTREYVQAVRGMGGGARRSVFVHPGHQLPLRRRVVAHLPRRDPDRPHRLGVQPRR